MSYHANATEEEGSLAADVAGLPEPDRSEAESQREIVETAIAGMAELYGFEHYRASINGMHTSGLASINVMLTARPAP